MFPRKPLPYCDTTKPQKSMAANLTHWWLNSHLSDVDLIVADERLPAHKVVLAATSSVFEEVLSPTVEDAVPGQRLVLTVHNMEPTVLRMVLRYMYSSEVDTVFRTTLPRYAAQLWMAAARFRIDELQQALRAYLLQHMTALHCVELLSTLALATDSDHPPPFHLCRQLEQRAVACFRRHAGAIFASTAWMEWKRQDSSGVLVLLQYVTDARFLEPAESGDHENVDNTPVMSP